MPASPLTVVEREEIRAGVERGETITCIAQALGRHRCTVSAEVARNGGRAGYSAVAAQARADRSRARPKAALLVADPDLGWEVTKRLMANDSPKTISLELKRGVNGVTAKISHETIYQAIYANGKRGLPAKIGRCLHRRRRTRKRRPEPGQATKPPSPLGDFALITTRPPAAAARTEVGHCEGDLLCGASNRTALITVFDRATRYLWLAGFDGRHDAPSTAQALIELIERMPEHLRRTLTWDQGREMADWATVTEATGIDIYFAEPRSPWQRPTNENGNGLLRHWFPKGTDLSIHTPEDLRRIEHRINTIPRHSLNWDTAHNIYYNAV